MSKNKIFCAQVTEVYIVLVYSQTWLNLPTFDYHILLHLFMDDSHLNFCHKTPKKKTLCVYLGYGCPAICFYLPAELHSRRNTGTLNERVA
jgi:hypothetical protein